MHHTRQMIVDAIQGSEYLTVRLGEGDTAWGGQRGIGKAAGPGVVTYGRLFPWDTPKMTAFDPLADDHDPRCDATNPEGDVCRLLPGDHLAHYWGEPDGDDPQESAR